MKIYTGTKIYNLTEITEKTDDSTVLVYAKHFQSLMARLDDRENQVKSLKDRIAHLEKRLERESDPYSILDMKEMLEELHHHWVPSKESMDRLDKVIRVNKEWKQLKEQEELNE